MDQLRPGAVAIVGGGVIVLIASFLDWFGPFSAYENRLFGLTGVFLLIFAAICIAFPLVDAVAPDVHLPESVAGLTRNQFVHALGMAVLVLSFSLLFRESSARLGTILALIGSLAIIGGSQMEGSRKA